MDETEETPQIQPQESGGKFDEISAKLKKYWEECVRVFKVTRKPDMHEYKATVKASALGIAAIGLVGFLIFFVKEMIFR